MVGWLTRRPICCHSLSIFSMTTTEVSTKWSDTLLISWYFSMIASKNRSPDHTRTGQNYHGFCIKHFYLQLYNSSTCQWCFCTLIGIFMDWLFGSVKTFPLDVFFWDQVTFKLVHSLFNQLGDVTSWMTVSWSSIGTTGSFVCPSKC